MAGKVGSKLDLPIDLITALLETSSHTGCHLGNLLHGFFYVAICCSIACSDAPYRILESRIHILPWPSYGSHRSSLYIVNEPIFTTHYAASSPPNSMTSNIGSYIGRPDAPTPNPPPGAGSPPPSARYIRPPSRARPRGRSLRCRCRHRASGRPARRWGR
jgi:hypothetical protein